MTAYAVYKRGLVELLWRWSETHHADALDGHRPPARPVLRKERAADDALVPVNQDRADKIREGIPHRARHRWFRSGTSS